MLENWIKIGKRRKKLINKIIALDSKNKHTIERLSSDNIETLQLKLFWLQQTPTRCQQQFVNKATNDHIEKLIKRAKDDGIWDENPKEGKWV